MNCFETLHTQALEKWQALQHGTSPLIFIGTASCGRAAGALEVLEAVRSTLAELHSDARIVQVGCIGPCYLEPLMDIALPGKPRLSYAQVTPARARKIISAALTQGDLSIKMAKGHFGDETFTAQTGLPRFFDLPMLKPQVRVILRNCGLIDPEDIDHYLALDGYQGFVKALEMRPEEVIQELKISGLRGRGGAGFQTYKKWELCWQNPHQPKYVICNADEGDPGAFMNRSLIEGDPHCVLEGMLIAGRTIGASEGVVYVRAEYPLAVARLRKAIGQMRDYGLLGQDILGSGFNFNITIREGAGAFVCGEETALIASLEGERGMPRLRPPYPAEKGLHGQPTLINNTETLGILPNILRRGGAWFQKIGVSGSSGTKTFSLVGKVRNTGLIEVPLGTTLRQIVYEIGGGTKKPFKAIQTGGPLGGCLSAEHLDTPVDYESLAAKGSIIGSGGLIVMDESTCIVDVAHYFHNFCQHESCGKCTPCRTGNRILINVLDKIMRGDGEESDLEMLERLADTMKRTSLCGLGQNAANPVTSTLLNFRQEYEAHIHDKYCPAGVCTSLFEYHILAEKCNACGRCLDVCSTGAILGERKQAGRSPEPFTIDVSLCSQCRSCVEICAREAIVGFPRSSQPEPDIFSEQFWEQSSERAQ